jgi:hypothetical protein
VLKHGTREGKQKPARKGGFCKLSNHPCLCANLFRVPRHPRSLRSSPQRHLRLLIFSTPPIPFIWKSPLFPLLHPPRCYIIV